jgi:hypothetical protein
LRIRLLVSFDGAPPATRNFCRLKRRLNEA